MKIKQTEYGWANHFICHYLCRFRRATLLKKEDLTLIVSSVGDMRDTQTGNIHEPIGLNVWFETKVFRAIYDPDEDCYVPLYNDELTELSKELRAPSWIDLVTETTNPYVAANNMHNKVVKKAKKYIKQLLV